MIKLTREITSAINRRAYALSQQAMKRWADDLKAAIQAGDLTFDEIDAWQPEAPAGGVAFDPPGTARDCVLDATDHLAGF